MQSNDDYDYDDDEDEDDDDNDDNYEGELCLAYHPQHRHNIGKYDQGMGKRQIWYRNGDDNDRMLMMTIGG